MDTAQDQTELAATFQAETDELVALDRRIDRLMRERGRLEMAFDAVAAAVDAALACGEAPLALADELDPIDQRLQRLEHDLTAAMQSATKSISGS